MGYGGIIKSVVRVAASVVGGIACGPPCAAIGSAVATGATGGSFKESLMAGATSYIGASVSRGVSGAITDASSNVATNSLPTTFIDSTGAQLVNVGETIPAGFAGAGTELTGDLVSQGIADAALVGIRDATAPIDSAVTEFGDATKEALGIVNGVNRTPFDVITESGKKGLEALGFDTTPMQFSTAGALAGGLTELTLNQALLDPVGQYDDILAQKFSPEQIQWLKREARNQLSQQAFDRLIAETTNPGLAEDEFNKIIAAGIERENVDLGPDITEQQFNERFNTPNLGQLILDDERDLRRQSFTSNVNRTFTGNAFDPIDDDIINSIVDERAGPARQQISNFAARGNLNPIGGRSANEFVTNQEESARNRVRQAGDAVLGGTQQRINQLGDEARSTAGGFNLGDDLFDVTPFAEQRQNIIEEQQGTLRDDINTSLGSEPLFDINAAIQSGGRAQGSVSGSAPNQGSLDAIAAREGSISSGRNRRGLGTRGSGAF